MTTARIRTTVLGLCATFAIALTALMAPSGPAHAEETEALAATGCPRGAVCIYPGVDYNGGKPSYIFWSYGVHKIYDESGWHLVLNNQTDGAKAYLCDGGDGTECLIDVNGPREKVAFLHWVNSVRLTP